MTDVLTREDINYTVAGQALDQIINFNEILVLEVMKEIYDKDKSLCTCSLCIEDVYALALNKIPPRYIQPTNIDLYEKSDSFIGKNEIKAHVQSAVDKVKVRPGH